MDTLEQQLTKETILESNCQNAFRVLKTQFEKIFTSVLIKPSSLDEVKASDAISEDKEKRVACWVNEDKMQTTEDKVDSSKALDASLVDTKSSGTTLKEQDTSNISGNDAHADDADIRPIYDEEPMVEVQTTVKSISLLLDNNILSNLNSIMKERWVSTGKIFTSSTTKVDSEPTNGLNKDITNQYECEKTLDVNAGTLNLSAGTSFNPKKEGLRVYSELGIHYHTNEPSSSKLVPKVITSADTTASSKQELDLLFCPLYDEFFTACTSCVNKSSSHTENSTQQDTPPSANAQSTIELITPTITTTAVDNM
ncbi:hypothetical protein Tco_0452206 [Tanacetum coccineum]